MRTHFTFLAGAFVLSTLVPSSAIAANPPTLGAVPETRLPEMLHPKDSPESLPSTEAMTGVRVLKADLRQFGTVESSDGRCITLGALAPGAGASGNSNATIRVSSGAFPMRTEKFVGAGTDKPSLEIVDGWVDMKSSGVREVRTTQVPLTVLGSGPAGYSIYGFRNDGKLHVIFPTPQRFVFVDAFGKFGVVGCQHARLILDAKATSASLVRVSGMLETRRSLPRGLVSNAGAAAQPVTLRGIAATVSLSQTKRDREPLLSVTAGWTEDEPLLPLIDSAQAADVAMPIEEDERGGMSDRE